MFNSPKALIGDQSVECLGHPQESHTYPFLQLAHPFVGNTQESSSCSSSSQKPIQLRACSPDQIEAALRHADVVSDANSPWSSLPLKDRYEILKEAAAAIDAEQKVYANQDVLETGIPLPVQYQIVAGLGPMALGSMEKAMSDVLESKQKVPSRFGGNIVGKRRPISPALIIAPWNVPCGTIVPKLFCALLCGCKVIVKPSEYAPSSITQMCHTIHSIIYGKYKIPNVLQLVHGGGVVGSTLVGAKEIQCVQFTGAPKTAALVASQCAPLLKPLLAECGGSNSLIICKDACLTSAIRYCSMGTITLNGQWCMGVSRVFVHKSLKDDFLKLLRNYLEKRVKLMCSATDMEGIMAKTLSDVDEAVSANTTSKELVFLELGPLASEAHASSIRSSIQELSGSVAPSNKNNNKNGNNIFTLYDVEKVWNENFNSNSSAGEDAAPTTSSTTKTIPSSYLSPQCIIEPDPQLSAKRELFGPVFSLHVFENEDEAIKMTNLSTGMLACYIFSKDVERAQKIGLQLRTGMSMVNSTNFGFEAEDPSMEIEADFWGSAGSGSDGTGAAAAKFFSRLTWCGVSGDQDHVGHELH